eukprot:5625740-Prymnesium_polylepis.1
MSTATSSRPTAASASRMAPRPSCATSGWRAAGSCPTATCGPSAIASSSAAPAGGVASRARLGRESARW